MLVVEFWSVDVIGDCEGRSSRTVARFTKKCEAIAFSERSEGRDMYGLVGNVKLNSIEIFESADDASDSIKRSFIESARAKLTQQERDALGIG